jgi:hypothetical protein
MHNDIWMFNVLFFISDNKKLLLIVNCTLSLKVINRYLIESPRIPRYLKALWISRYYNSIYYIIL